MNEELVEKVAIAISDDVNLRFSLGDVSWPAKGALAQAEYRSVARAAIKAMQEHTASAIPKFVPSETWTQMVLTHAKDVTVRDNYVKIGVSIDENGVVQLHRPTANLPSPNVAIFDRLKSQVVVQDDAEAVAVPDEALVKFSVEECSACDGTGRWKLPAVVLGHAIDEPCALCDGKGRVSEAQAQQRTSEITASFEKTRSADLIGFTTEEKDAFREQLPVPEVDATVDRMYSDLGGCD